MKTHLSLILVLLLFFNCKKDVKETPTDKEVVIEDTTTVATPDTAHRDRDILIHPINHATMVLEYEKTIIYVDPVGGIEAFEGLPNPRLIFVTDIHGDHMDIETLKALHSANTQLIVPKEVAAKLPESLKPNMAIMSNGQNISMKSKTMDVKIEAIPMYNLREEALKFHEKGRGNGYVLTIGGKRIYISGDTEDIPEMRNLENIDIAFVCMNLPYTMTVESAADAVLQFKPKKVYPYHYRGTNGYSDVEKFKSIVNEGNSDIEVMLLNWYSNE
jgi:L-ascorbate metabolism protein UlaG (beta-lactamase superfamily)